MTFKQWDQVKLAFGGPRMTVVHVTSAGMVHAWWFDANGALQRIEAEAELFRLADKGPWADESPSSDWR
jgi:uncharacterized protein YodC (DUF2158 family)